MSWLGGIYPEPPSGLEVKLSDSGDGKFLFQWKVDQKQSGDSIAYFGLYSLPHPAAELLPDYMLDVIPVNQNSYSLTIDKPDRVNYYFTLNSISKLWNESIESSNVVALQFDQLKYFLNDFDDLKPVLVNNGENSYTLVISSPFAQNISLIGFNGSALEIILESRLQLGQNIFSINKDLKLYSSLKINFTLSGRELEIKF
jgi:hypothetical protein